MNNLEEFKSTKQLCELLMKEPSYQALGPQGIFAIIETSKALGIDPRLALGGGLYYVRGKVEMSARMMNALIRSKKHSITRDKRSDDKICILHGKRSDNGDTWTESFSIEEADRAGLLKNPTWKIYPKDMLFARALSRLARQLFPDVIGNCYVEGEISISKEEETKLPEIEDKSKEDKISEEEFKNLTLYLDKLPEYKEVITEFLSRKGISNLWEMPKDFYSKVLDNCKQKIAELDKEKEHETRI